MTYIMKGLLLGSFSCLKQQSIASETTSFVEQGSVVVGEEQTTTAAIETKSNKGVKSFCKLSV